MAKILFGWEHGGGMGHISPISAFVRRLQERGHEIHAIAKDTFSLSQAIGDFSIPCYALPAQMKVDKKFKIDLPVSMAELLFNLGWHTPTTLIARLVAWRSLIEVVRPDVMVLNYAPGGILAARNLSVPAVQFGTGYEIPWMPVPDLSPGTKQGKVVRRVRASEEAMVRKVNKGLEPLEWAPIERMQEVFSTDRDLLVTFPELDHSRARRGGQYVGPLISTPLDNPPAWPQVKEGAPRIFGYLKSWWPALDPLLESLASLDARILLYISRFPKKQQEKYASDSLCFSPKPVNLQRACQESDLVLCHAGHGTVATALLCGAPLLLLPEKGNGEQKITVRNVQRVHGGLGRFHTAGKEDFQGALNKLLNEGAGSGAAEFQEKHADFDPESAWTRVVEEVEELAG